MGINLNTTSKKLLASGALIATAAAVAGIGTYGTFSDSVSVDAQVATGTLAIGWDNGTQAVEGDNALVFVGKNLAPGDKVVRTATLRNYGTLPLKSLKLRVDDADFGLVSDVDDTEFGLAGDMEWIVERCPRPWEGTVEDLKCVDGTTGADQSEAVMLPNSAPWHLPKDGWGTYSVGGMDHLKITARVPDSYAEEGAWANIALKIDASPVTKTVDGKPQ